MERKKVTISDLSDMKEKGSKITMLTAYDFSLAALLEKAGIDIVLVGDSLGNVVLGYDSTVPVTMDDMVHHTKAARRGVSSALLVSDMPFMSFNVSIEQSIMNAGRLIKEAGADAVKIEGGNEQTLVMIKAIVGAGIPVMGHIGLTPQTATMLGGLKVQGKTAQAAKQIIQQALALEEAGCFIVVLECIPDILAQLITKKLKIPTIGIGAGAGCGGQVLVTYDMLGLYERFNPKFVKQYARLSEQITAAVEQYINEVRQEKFPSKEYSFIMKEDECRKLES